MPRLCNGWNGGGIANDGVSLGRISISEAERCERHDEEQFPNLVELLSRIASEDLRENRIAPVFVCCESMSGREGEGSRQVK